VFSFPLSSFALCVFSPYAGRRSVFLSFAFFFFWSGAFGRVPPSVRTVGCPSGRYLVAWPLRSYSSLNSLQKSSLGVRRPCFFSPSCFVSSSSIRDALPACQTFFGGRELLCSSFQVYRLSPFSRLLFNPILFYLCSWKEIPS